jgi:hypothetical protein
MAGGVDRNDLPVVQANDDGSLPAKKLPATTPVISAVSAVPRTISCARKFRHPPHREFLLEPAQVEILRSRR